MQISRAAAGLVVGIGLGAVAVWAPLGFAGKRTEEAAPATPIVVPPAAVTAATPVGSFAPLVDTVKPAVVAIAVEGTRGAHDQVPAPFRQFLGELPDQKVHGEGSGFVVSADGYVLTNNHVVDGADAIVARFADGREVQATVVGTDPATDIALLKLVGDETWPHVALDGSDELRVGDWVVAVGNPLGLGITVTAGIVSGTGRVLGHDAYDDFIQTDAAINQGNSGGPLFDTQGRVVGMNTAIIQGANTVGFAVPAEMIREVVDELRTDGRVSRGYLGVQLQTMDVTLAKAMGAPDTRGALVAEVEPGTPAAEAGLVEGDVIVAFGPAAVTDSQGLVREVARHDPGEEVELKLMRGGKPTTATITLAERPGVPGEPVEVDAPEVAKLDGKRLGIALEPLSANAARALGTDEGVVVSQVDPSGPAEGKLQRGDVIQAVDGEPVADPTALKAALQAAGDTVVLKVVSRGRTRFVAIER